VSDLGNGDTGPTLEDPGVTEDSGVRPVSVSQDDAAVEIDPTPEIGAGGGRSVSKGIPKAEN
jgi:hypothetical protein